MTRLMTLRIAAVLSTIATFGSSPGQAGAQATYYPGSLPTNPFPLAPAEGSPYSQSPYIQWLGGDGATGVTLFDGQTSFWFFSDTYWNYLGNTQRLGTYYLGNTMAVSNSQNGFNSVYIYTGDSNLRFPFFNYSGSNLQNLQRYWVRKPILAQDPQGTVYLFVFLGLTANVQYHPTGVAFQNTTVARIKNPQDTDPRLWQPDYLILHQVADPQTEVDNPILGQEAFVYQSNMYVYGTYASSSGMAQTVAVQLPLSAMFDPQTTDLSSSVKYLYNPNYPSPNDYSSYNWTSGFPGVGNSDYVDLLIYSSVGFSVRFNAAANRWQAIYIPAVPCQPKVPYVYGLGSIGPFGPWDKYETIATLPELDAAADPPGNPDPSNYQWYSAVEATGFASDPASKIRFTYTYSSTQMNEILEDNNLYMNKSLEVNNTLHTAPLSPQYPAYPCNNGPGGNASMPRSSAVGRVVKEPPTMMPTASPKLKLRWTIDDVSKPLSDAQRKAVSVKH